MCFTSPFLLSSLVDLCMKTLFLLRHAKSDWANSGMSDHERPLNSRGQKEAPLIGNHLKNEGILPDLWLSSTAKRAEQTILAVANVLSYNKSVIQFDEKLYDFSFPPYVDVLKSCDSVHNSILLVAHNPSLEEFASFLIGDDWERYEIPTAGLLKFDLAIQNWVEIKKGCGKMHWFITPKTLNQ